MKIWSVLLIETTRAIVLDYLTLWLLYRFALKPLYNFVKRFYNFVWYKLQRNNNYELCYSCSSSMYDCSCYDNDENTTTTDANGNNTSASNGGGTPSKKANPNELPAPKRILYPRENVRVGWKATGRKWDVGVGMMNVGNTCYLNSTLQAVFHVPSMANWLISDSAHMERCESTDTGCIICAMTKTLQESQKSQSAIRPYYVYSKLKSICKHLVMGRQEDAHEFLRYLVEAMEKSYLSRFRNYKELDQYSKETTPLNQILGGYLKSSVRCLTCNHVSVTFQHFQDLLLDIRKADTVDEALEGYFSRERLEDMGYKCEACKKKVSATKQFSLERAPIALCIQLKRFSMLGTKLNKQITIKPRLDLTKFASRKNPGEQLTYRLVAMVTHLGASQHCGHYTAIGLTESGTYYNYDDSYVRPISMQNVCNTNAYIIFYEIDTQPPKNVNSTQVSGAQATATATNQRDIQTVKMNGHALGGSARIIGPQLPPGYNNIAITNGGSVTSSSSPLTNGGSKLILNRNSTSLPSSTSSTSTSSNGGSSKIMIHFKNNNNISNSTNVVKSSAATSSITSVSATSSSSTFDNLKNSSSTTTNCNSNGLHLVGAGKFQESTNTKYPLGVSTLKRQVNNLKNSNESSSDDDDEHEIVSSSTSSQIHNATQATLPSMPKLGVDSTNITSSTLTNGFAKKSPAPIKSLVPYGSETDEEADVCISATTTNAATTASSEQQKRLLPNPLKRRQSSSSWSSSSSSDNDIAKDKDIKPSNGIKIKKAASSTAAASKIPSKSAPDTIDEIFNSIKRSNNTNTTNTTTTSGITTLKKKIQNQQFTVTSSTTTADSSTSDSEDESIKTKMSSNIKPQFKRSHSTPPSPPVVKTNSGIWQVTTLPPITACISPTTSAPSSSAAAAFSTPASIEKTPKNHKNPFAAKPIVAADNAKRVKKDTANKTISGNGYQRSNSANESLVSELLKQSHRGYGAPILTWNGQQSEIDKENFYLFDEKRIEDDDSNNNNINYNNISNRNEHDLCHDDNDDIKQISSLNHHYEQNDLVDNNVQQHQQNEYNQSNDHKNIIIDSNEPDLELNATKTSTQTDDEEELPNDMLFTTSITSPSYCMDDVQVELAAKQYYIKENDVQQMMDDEMENIDSCSSGTTTTTVINNYCPSPNSSLLTTIPTTSPPPLLAPSSSSAALISTNSILPTTATTEETTSNAFIISEAREQRQRDWEDEEENEMDRGRQKKVKAPKDPYATTGTPGYNPFQEQENQKRWKRYHHVGGGSGGYRHNFQRNKFKFQRFQHKFPKKNMNGGGNSILNVNRRNDS